MKQMILTVVLAMSGSTLFAQSSVTPVKADAPVVAQDEVRAVSAQLKEAYGILSQDLAHLGREVGPDATKATPEQTAMRERMTTALAQLEGMLSTVNSGDAAQWTEIKAKAEAVRKNALAIVEERKAKR